MRWYATCIICALLLAWGIGFCGKNIGIGLIEIAKALKEKNSRR